jgi:hypothetical protein
VKFYQELFKKNEYLFANDEDRLIAVFDDEVYDRGDVDMLHPAQRSYVSNFLQQHGHRVLTGKILAHLETDQQVIFCGTSSLGVSPLIELKRCWNDEAVFVVTPTTFAMHLVDTYGLQALEKLKALIAVCPINILKISDLFAMEHNTEVWHAMVAELTQFQQTCLAQQTKKRKPLT